MNEIIYPVFVTYLQYENAIAGIYLGATIHDVVQVVGAGYIISDQTGEISTFVKLIRVTCLVPGVIAISLLMHRRRSAESGNEPLRPWFLWLSLCSSSSTVWAGSQ